MLRTSKGFRSTASENHWRGRTLNPRSLPTRASPRGFDPLKLKTLLPRHKAGATVFVELAGLEPATLCLQSRCATSCAIAPLEQETHYRYFHTPGSLRRSFAAFTSQAKNTPINNSFKVFFKSTYLADCWNKLPLQWA